MSLLNVRLRSGGISSEANASNVETGLETVRLNCPTSGDCQRDIFEEVLGGPVVQEFGNLDQSGIGQLRNEFTELSELCIEMSRTVNAHEHEIARIGKTAACTDFEEHKHRIDEVLNAVSMLQQQFEENGVRTKAVEDTIQRDVKEWIGRIQTVEEIQRFEIGQIRGRLDMLTDKLDAAQTGCTTACTSTEHGVRQACIENAYFSDNGTLVPRVEPLKVNKFVERPNMFHDEFLKVWSENFAHSTCRFDAGGTDNLQLVIGAIMAKALHVEAGLAEQTALVDKLNEEQERQKNVAVAVKELSQGLMAANRCHATIMHTLGLSGEWQINVNDKLHNLRVGHDDLALQVKELAESAGMRTKFPLDAGCGVGGIHQEVGLPTASMGSLCTANISSPCGRMHTRDDQQVAGFSGCSFFNSKMHTQVNPAPQTRQLRTGPPMYLPQSSETALVPNLSS